MLNHYFKTALRGILKDKQYFLINVIGLSVALSIVILIALFVRDELGYDKWLTGHNRIYKLEATATPPGGAPVKVAYTPGRMAPELNTRFENEIEHAVRVYPNETSVRRGTSQFNETVHYVDQGFFDIFNIPFNMGASDAVLSNSNNIAISKSMATKYFGTENPIGQILDINHSPSASRIDYQVVAVFDDIPSNSHLNSTFIALLDPSRYVNWPWVTEDWNSLTNHTYVKFNETADITSFQNNFASFTRTLPITANNDADKTPRFTFSMINVADIHLKSTALRPLKPGGDIKTVNTFSMIAILILIMASINFTNLASAQAIKKAKEVSIRKVMGANRKQLIAQFLGETILTSFIAMIIGVAVVEMLLPLYNDFLGKNITLYPLSNPLEAITLLGFSLFVGICAGFYPAFVSSSFRPAKILLANKSDIPGSTKLRHILLVVQFTISIGLIISTLIIYAQTLYSQNIDAGFEKENRIVLSGSGFNQVAPASKLLKEQIANIPGVKSVGISSDSFPNQYGNFANFLLPESNNAEPVNIQTMYMDADFLKTYGVIPVAGRLFSNDFIGDFETIPENDNLPITRSAVVNEGLVKLAGYENADDAIGKVIRAANDRPIDITIVGVVNDLHTESTRQTPTPQVYFATEAGLDFITVHLNDAYNGEMGQRLERVWGQVLPDVPLISNLTTDVYDALYIDETRRTKIFATFSLLSIFISSIGLYGLAAFVAESRTREIGIRKVLGATVLDIVKLLIIQFSKPVLIANIIAWPVAYLNMEEWLSTFAYRIDISLAYFLFAGGITLLIAWGVVIGHALKIARANPVHALRSN
ncbi:ABC transporter permease [Pseudemcibacter aquimaris]|uniref:ABC transporter permease n=1 Tax=Pseudemcibacter aquimaris TaxID=2857064 RepID=UPI00201208E2|nr:ABC transporter permease [Pseudemcibacter aquimaris]MCC3860126.1 ABC transporter permease [Pseudemcibacter aquimaris]WDU57453.1 ABC transporter permease [Pseudemcibacter aquimaris]